jgi:hypothetical protein
VVTVCRAFDVKLWLVSAHTTFWLQHVERLDAIAYEREQTYQHPSDEEIDYLEMCAGYRRMIRSAGDAVPVA